MTVIVRPQSDRARLASSSVIPRMLGMETWLSEIVTSTAGRDVSAAAVVRIFSLVLGVKRPVSRESRKMTTATMRIAATTPMAVTIRSNCGFTSSSSASLCFFLGAGRRRPSLIAPISSFVSIRVLSASGSASSWTAAKTSAWGSTRTRRRSAITSSMAP